MLPFDGKQLLELFKQFGIVGGLTVVLVLYLLFAHARTMDRLIKQMQAEIDRLADDNRKYRDEYLKRLGWRKEGDDGES